MKAMITNKGFSFSGKTNELSAFLKGLVERYGDAKLIDIQQGHIDTTPVNNGYQAYQLGKGW